MFKTFPHALAEFRSGLKKPPRCLSAAQKAEVRRIQGTRPDKACSFCASPCQGRRTAWCSQQCLDDYFLACNDPKAVELALQARDKEVCQSCGLDTKLFLQDILNLPLDRIQKNLWRLEGFISEVKLGAFEPTLGGTRMLLHEITRARLWQAHHVVPVSQGGGLCGLEGFLTLCLRCHKAFHNKVLNYHTK